MDFFRALLRCEKELHSAPGVCQAVVEPVGSPQDAPPPKQPACAVCSRPHGPFITCSRADCGREYHRGCLRETRLYTPRQPGWVCPPCRHDHGWGVSLEELQLSLDDPQLTQLVLPHMATLGCLVSASAKRHSDTCGACGKIGELLLCDGCPRAYHHACTDVAHVPLAELEDATWFCVACKAAKEQESKAGVDARSSDSRVAAAAAAAPSPTGAGAGPASGPPPPLAASALTTAPSLLADMSNLPPRVPFDGVLTASALFNASPPAALSSGRAGEGAETTQRGRGVAAKAGRRKGRRGEHSSEDEDDDDEDDSDADSSGEESDQATARGRGRRGKGGKATSASAAGGRGAKKAVESDPSAVAAEELFYRARELLGHEPKPKKGGAAAAKAAAKAAAAKAAATCGAPPAARYYTLGTFYEHVGVALAQAEAGAWDVDPPQYNKIRRSIYLCPKPKLYKGGRDADVCSCAAANISCDHRCENTATYRECTKANCSYGADEEGKCGNRRVQRRGGSKVVIRPTPGKGWGLFAAEDIYAGDFLVEYVGEIIDDEECGRRNEVSKREGTVHVYMMQLSPELVIDAAHYGNESRFINHSCQPNCATEKWEIAGEIRACIFAKHDIPAGTELTYDYEFESFAEERWECQCGEPGCRGFLGVSKREALDAAALEAAGLSQARSELRHNAKAAAIVAASAAEEAGGEGGTGAVAGGSASASTSGGSAGAGPAPSPTRGGSLPGSGGSASGRSPRGQPLPAWRLGPIKRTQELAMYADVTEDKQDSPFAGGPLPALAALQQSSVPSTKEALFIRRQRLFIVGVPPARRNLFTPASTTPASRAAVAAPSSSAGTARVVAGGKAGKGAGPVGPAWHRKAWEALAAKALEGEAASTAAATSSSTKRGASKGSAAGIGAWPGLEASRRAGAVAGKKRRREQSAGTSTAGFGDSYVSSHYPALAAEAVAAAAPPAGQRRGYLFSRYVRLVDLLSRLQFAVQGPVTTAAVPPEEADAALASAFAAATAASLAQPEEAAASAAAASPSSKRSTGRAGKAAAGPAPSDPQGVPLASCPDSVMLSALASRLWEWVAGIYTDGGAVEDDDLAHDIACSKCWGTGSVVCCDSCSRVWHPSCLGLMEHDLTSAATWACPECARGAGEGKGRLAGRRKRKAGEEAATAAEGGEGSIAAPSPLYGYPLSVLAPLMAAAEAAAAAAPAGTHGGGVGAGSPAAALSLPLGSRSRRSTAARGSSGFPPVLVRALWHLAAASGKPLPRPDLRDASVGAMCDDYDAVSKDDDEDDVALPPAAKRPRLGAEGKRPQA